MGNGAEPMMVETRARSVLKAASYRAFGTLITALIVFVCTGRIKLAIGAGAVEAAAKVVLFFFHERLWNRIRYGRREAAPAVVWFTGLPGSGKSTLARRTAAALRDAGHRVEYLDGDSVRRIFPSLGFARSERDMHIRRVGHLASVLEGNGVTVVASFVSPYAESRGFVRGLCRNFIEVHVSTPLEVCERRDPKGLYAKARRGEIGDMTGVGDPYEAPAAPEVAVDTSVLSEPEAVEAVLRAVAKRLDGRGGP